MSELAQSVQAPEGSEDATAVEGETHPSVRELLTELAALEDATRAPRGSDARHGVTPSAECLAALAREQEIIDELHRRCPDTPCAS